MDHGPSTHDVVIERHGSVTDDTGWTTTSGRAELWTGRGTLWPAGGRVARQASADDSGPLAPTETSEWVIALPILATVEPGDIAVIDGQDYAVGRVIKRRGAVASLDHLRVEVTAL